MTSVELNSKAIGAIRRLVDTYTSRDELKQFLLDAGANSDRILSIHVSGNMKSSTYKSKSTILNEGFDTIPADFKKQESDGVMLELVRIVFSRKQVSENDRANLEGILSANGLVLSEILGSGLGQDLLHHAVDSSEAASFRETSELLKKALLRTTTDPTGAITAAVSAAESVCREALSRLGLPEPSSKQLPKFLVELRRNTNIEELARIPNVEDRVITALSSLAENSYRAAHETGDRHAHGDTAVPPSPLIVDMVVTSACAITVVLTGALRRNELRVKRQSGVDANDQR
jgi:hypothetical protein